MTDSALRIVVTGLIGQHPLGGVVWDYIQYVLGLKRLGHDVYYFEDSGEWPYSRDPGASGRYEAIDCSENVQHLDHVMRSFDLQDRWAFRCAMGGTWHGMTSSRREDVLSSADLLLNVSGSLVQPERYTGIRRLAYIDSDPVFTQIRILNGKGNFGARVDAHDVHFTFGETLPPELAATGHRWIPTRQPVVLSEWVMERPRRDVYTTVMNWTSYKAVSYGGRRYGQKNVELKSFTSLPRLVEPVRLELALKAMSRKLTPGALRTRLARQGWQITDPAVVCPDFESYRAYIESSKGEWSIAKNGYVAGNSGWFSCRSACYLAAGRPAVVQDTGFSRVLPVGDGLLAFGTLEEAAERLLEVEARYDHHARAALDVATEYFDSDRVLARLVEEATSTESGPAPLEARA
jgi:hypothetical protein